MGNVTESLKEAMEVDGAIGVALVDYGSGMTLGVAGGRDIDLEVAAAGNTDVVRAKMRTVERLGLGMPIEDILITLSGQYHIIRPLATASGSGLFLYCALNRQQANLAMARRQLAIIAERLVV
ncbi:MAG: hypothetical protein ACFCVF_02935 [Kineosporiaceae bacterium]